MQHAAFISHRALATTGTAAITQARSALTAPRIAGCRSRARFVETTSSATEAEVVFPAIACLLRPIPVGAIRCSALLRLADDTVWFLRSVGHAFTASRVAAARRVLAARGPLEGRGALLRDALADALAMPGLELLPPPLEAFDPDTWCVERVARSLARPLSNHHCVGHASRYSGGQEYAALAQAMRAELAQAFEKFLLGLDSTAAAAARRDGVIDPDLYNYFASDPNPGWRLQFARTMPLMLRAAACPNEASGGAVVRIAVDQGLPLLGYLAGQWGVSQASVRSLNGVRPEVAGSRWEGEVPYLLRLLDALRPQDLPRNDADKWSAFNAAVAHTQRLFGWRTRPGLPARAWLREAGRRGFRGAAPTTEDNVAFRRRGEVIERLEAAFSDALTAEMTTASTCALAHISAAAQRIAAGYLLDLREPDLAAAADRFALEASRIDADAAKSAAMRAGTHFWPLLPRPITSSDGTRRVVPLTRAAELHQQGHELRQCVSDDRYRAACATGEQFIVSVIDTQSGQVLSTAHFRLRTEVRGSRIVPMLREHKGASNRRASIPCATAIAEVMRYLESNKAQDHLRARTRYLSDLRFDPRNPDPETRKLRHRAVAAAIGSKLYRRAVAMMRADSGAAPSVGFGRTEVSGDECKEIAT